MHYITFNTIKKSIHRSQVNKVTWIFCPGHAGVLGNKQADKLAGLALVKEKLHYNKKDVTKTVIMVSLVNTLFIFMVVRLD